jgi:BlaI family penicillinase repressor
MKEGHTLGDLQLAIMRVLWADGEATVATVYERLYPVRGLALSTIATMLRKMEARGLVAHREEGRLFVFRPLPDQGEVHRGMVGQLINRLFGGDPLALVDHLIREGEIDTDQLDALRQQMGLDAPAPEEDVHEG